MAICGHPELYHSDILQGGILIAIISVSFLSIDWGRVHLTPISAGFTKIQPCGATYSCSLWQVSLYALSHLTYTTPEKHQSRHVRLCLVWVQPVCVALYVLYSAELTFLACVHNESAFIGMNGCHLGVQSVSWQQKLAVFGKITDKTAGE